MSDSDSDSDDSIVDGVGAIVPIQQQDVHRIVSGQVISDMSSAVKELVDNALDAGASCINIRLFNQGVDVIEVSDDGSGVPKHSRPLLAMKHATSKIMSFDDLYTDVVIDGQVQLQASQLGFRGEALFSLVQVSQNLIICTRTESETMAQQIQFTRDGYLNPSSVKDVARKVGTTVAVVKLFEKLPVRRADMMKRLKAQRAKLFKLMQAYAVLCVGVKFNLYDISGPVGSSSCKKEIKMSTTEKSKSIKETISSVFGSQFLSGLCMVKVDLSSIVDKALVKGNVTESEPQPKETKRLWRIEGMISNAPNSNQKIAREIQFFSINGRPVDLPKVSRLITEVWRNFESSEGSKKRPACILGLYLPNSMYDVNVSPDKREVFFSNDNEIYDLLREQLHKIWSLQTEGTFSANIVEKESNNNKNPAYNSSSVKLSSGNMVEKANGSSIKKTPYESSIIKPLSANLVESESKSCEEPPDKSPMEAVPTESKKRPYEAPVNTLPCDINSPSEDKKNRSSRRMRRRNAVYRTFDSAGNATTDQHMNGSKVSNEKSVNASDLMSIHSLKNTQEIESNGKMKGLHESPSKKMRHDLESFRLWNQTKLNFNSSPGSKTQLKEISDLEMLQRHRSSLVNNSSPSKEESGVGINKEHRINQGTISIGDKSSKVSYSSSTDSKPMTFDRLIAQARQQKKQSSSPVELNDYPHSTHNGAAKSTFDSRTLINENALEKEKVSHPPSKKRSNENTQCSNSPAIIEPKSPSQTAMKVTPSSPNITDSPSSSPTPQEQASQEEPTEPVVWEAFKDTKTILKEADAAYIKMMNRRTQLKELKSSRNKKHEDDLDNSDNPDANLSSTKGNVVKLSKEDFLTMKVIGQFNHGFILALCESGQLWILDQHACDEKYNFENLCRDTKIHEQKLMRPLPMELSPSEENCIVENMDVFEKNGFRFHYDETKPPRMRLSLTALPHSGSGGDGRKAVQFGKEDVGALCAILGADGASSNSMAGSGTGADGGGSMGNNAVRRHAGVGNAKDNAIIRLPKSIAMFASRACRSSIMIGDALSEKKMEEVVKRLHDIDQPWTCPHGRPTIRHIRDMLDQLIEDNKMSVRIVAGEFAALSQVSQDSQDEENLDEK